MKKEEFLKSVLNNEGLSLSHGSMRNEDLIPVFINCLFILNPEKAKELWRNNTNLLEALCDKNSGKEDITYFETNEAQEICFDLFDCLNNEAPEGFYFGAHPGDVSDFGFWKMEDYI